MPHCMVEFTDSELQQLRDLGIAVFCNRLILDSQPPITDAQIAKVENKVEGKIPSELLALWNTAFGGTLDYDYEIMFGNHLYNASLTELFYSGSKNYRDLDGWIEHEIELLDEVAEERGEPIPERTPFLPFGGFEYLERFYVSLLPEEFGEVLGYAQGIPWKGRLNEDSVTIVASSVLDFFDQLMLNEDPFDASSEEYAKGKNMVGRILEVEADHPELAEKLKSVLRSSIVDWRSAIETIDFAHQLSASESKALRVALRFAVNQRDTSVIDTLHRRGAPFDEALHGTGGILHFAMARRAFEIIERLLDLNVDFGNAPIIRAAGCSGDLLLRLIEYGALFDEEAIYSAAETGAINGAIGLANSEQVVKFEGISRVAASASKRAARHDEDAVKVESGKLSSYLTADQYREQAKALREFADRLLSCN